MNPSNTDRNAKILGLWSQSMTYGQIADHLGVTRNVVAGVVTRAGMRLGDRQEHARRTKANHWSRKNDKLSKAD